MGVPGLAAGDPRRSTLAVLNSVLGGGMSSRLFQEVREKRGLAYSVYSFSPSFSDAGLLGLYAGCSPAKATQVAELMRSEFHRLAAGGVSARRALARPRSAQRRIRAGPRGLRHPDVPARALARSPWASSSTSTRRCAGSMLVTAADVQELAQELVGPPVVARRGRSSRRDVVLVARGGARLVRLPIDHFPL